MTGIVGNSDMGHLDEVSPVDAERLVSGRAPIAEDLLPLAAVLEELRAEGRRRWDEDRAAAQFAAVMDAFAEHTEPGRDAAPRPAPRPLPRSQRTMTHMKKRLITASATLILLFATTGVAAAANGAAPGGALYAIDRALEGFGILDGGAAERLEEARHLVESGNVADGLEHAAASLAGTQGGTAAGGDASDALLAAAEEVRNRGDAASREVRANVAVLLDYLAEARAEGGVDGRHVAELARGIGGPPDHTPGPPDHTPGPPDHTPGPPGDDADPSVEVPGVG